MEHAMKKGHPGRLAWQETLMLHEVVMTNAINLIQFKKNSCHVKDPDLHKLYKEAIRGTETNLKELIPFYSYEPAPVRGGGEAKGGDNAFYSGALLIAIKCTVMVYTKTILETATSKLRKTLIKQLHALMDLHYKVFCYMLERGYYPAYNLKKLRENDVKMAEMALRN